MPLPNRQWEYSLDLLTASLFLYSAPFPSSILSNVYKAQWSKDWKKVEKSTIKWRLKLFLKLWSCLGVPLSKHNAYRYLFYAFILDAQLMFLFNNKTNLDFYKTYSAPIVWGCFWHDLNFFNLIKWFCFKFNYFIFVWAYLET